MTEGRPMTTSVQSETPKPVYVGAFVDPAQRRFLTENAREHDRSISAELRRAIRTYEEQTKGETH
jgi:hypothetical protein